MNWYGGKFRPNVLGADGPSHKIRQLDVRILDAIYITKFYIQVEHVLTMAVNRARC